MTEIIREGDTVGCFPANNQDGVPVSFAFVGEVMELRDDDQIAVVRVEILQHVPLNKVNKL